MPLYYVSTEPRPLPPVREFWTKDPDHFSECVLVFPINDVPKRSLESIYTFELESLISEGPFFPKFSKMTFHVHESETALKSG